MSVAHAMKTSQCPAVAAGSGAAFVLFARTAQRGAVGKREEHFFRAINGASSVLRAPAWLVMQAGSLWAVPVAAAAILPTRRDVAIAVAVDGVAVWASCKLAKRVIRRGRPVDHLDGVIIRGATQRGGGFPSGHAAVSTTIATIVGRVLPRRLMLIAFATAAIVAAARQYVGAHLPLDVLGGAAMGLFAGTVANAFFDIA